MDNKVRPWGKDDLMVLAAFRHCLGKRMYMVQDCADWLIINWSKFDDAVKDSIKRELEESFLYDDSCRLNNDEFRYLGDNCDRLDWERVRALWEESDDHKVSAV